MGPTFLLLKENTMVRYDYGAWRIPMEMLPGFSGKSQNVYPPFNIVELSELDFVIEVAVAGFTKDQLTVEREENDLTVTGSGGEDERTYFHKGIAGRGFEKKFRLAPDVSVTGADFINGILSIAMKRDIPEEKKPEGITIM